MFCRNINVQCNEIFHIAGVYSILLYNGRYYNNLFRFSYLGLYVFAGFTLDLCAVDYNSSVLRVFNNLPKLLK